MTTNRIKLSRADKTIKAILAATYPEWKGRKVSAEIATEYQMANYWSEGSRNYVVAYHLESGKTLDACTAAGVPMNQIAHARIGIPDGVLLVEHAIFCGKDCGVTIYVNAANMQRLLPQTKPSVAALERAYAEALAAEHKTVNALPENPTKRQTDHAWEVAGRTNVAMRATPRRSSSLWHSTTTRSSA